MSKHVEMNRVRHGELDLVEMSDAPDLTGYAAEPRVAGRLIVGHSETGAVHTIASPDAQLYRKLGSEIAYLVLGTEASLVHEGQRHKTAVLPARTYRVVTKRQANADESWQNVID